MQRRVHAAGRHGGSVRAGQRWLGLGPRSAGLLHGRLHRRLRGRVPRRLELVHAARAGRRLVAAVKKRRLLAAVVEPTRLHENDELDGRRAHFDVRPRSPLSAYWLVPQYELHGVDVAFTSVGNLEFMYDQAPKSMRSTAMALFWVSITLGNYASTLLPRHTALVEASTVPMGEDCDMSLQGNRKRGGAGGTFAMRC